MIRIGSGGCRAALAHCGKRAAEARGRGPATQVLTFAPLREGPPIAGIDSAWEGILQNGSLVRRRLLNEDETQGRRIRLPADAFSVQQVRLYRHR